MVSLMNFLMERRADFDPDGNPKDVKDAASVSRKLNIQPTKL